MTDLHALTPEEFDAENHSDLTPMIVDFWAPWCGSCRLLTPTVNKLAAELDGRARFAKLDVDDLPEMAERLGVMSVPTLVLYRSGKEVTRVSGVKGRQALLDEFLPHL
jgi:thioredoxin 1